MAFQVTVDPELIRNSHWAATLNRPSDALFFSLWQHVDSWIQDGVISHTDDAGLSKDAFIAGGPAAGSSSFHNRSGRAADVLDKTPFCFGRHFLSLGTFAARMGHIARRQGNADRIDTPQEAEALGYEVLLPAFLDLPAGLQQTPLYMTFLKRSANGTANDLILASLAFNVSHLPRTTTEDLVDTPIHEVAAILHNPEFSRYRHKAREMLSTVDVEQLDAELKRQIARNSNPNESFCIRQLRNSLQIVAKQAMNPQQREKAATLLAQINRDLALRVAKN